VQRLKGFPSGLAVLALFQADTALKAYAGYPAAKAGDASAALDLVIELAVPWLYANSNRFVAGLNYVAPHAQEATGDNAIPQTLAAVCAAVHRGKVDTEIVQIDRVFHTGADPMERMAARAQFSGDVLPGAQYVLVDDVTNLGGTLAELSNYIQECGGVVKDVVVLVNAGRNPALVPEQRYIRLIKERFNDEFTEVFGIAPDALTANEAKYLADFKSIDAIRNRLAKARQEIDRRLCSKGITRAAEETPLGTAGASASKDVGTAAPGGAADPSYL
jgi:hypoxanthine phosphoribosyltransferase